MFFYLNTLNGFEVDHSCFTPVYTHNTRHSKNIIFVVKRPRTRLGLNFKYLSPKLWFSVPEVFKNLKKDQFNYSYKKFIVEPVY